jgi:hypothetical protein
MFQFDPQVLKYLPADRLAEHLKQLHPGMVVTHGHHESLVPGYVKDLEWNFYDELHRQCVHDTYHGLYKVMTGKYFRSTWCAGEICRSSCRSPTQR